MKNEDSAVAQAAAQLAALKNTPPRLEAWSILLCEGDPKFADDEPVTMKLEGRIYNHPHPRFADGEIIQTLDLVALDVNAKRAGTRQTVYDLGEVDPTFLEYVHGLGKELSCYNLNERNIRNKPRAGL